MLIYIYYIYIYKFIEKFVIIVILSLHTARLYRVNSARERS